MVIWYCHPASLICDHALPLPAAGNLLKSLLEGLTFRELDNMLRGIGAAHFILIQDFGRWRLCDVKFCVISDHVIQLLFTVIGIIGDMSLTQPARSLSDSYGSVSSSNVMGEGASWGCIRHSSRSSPVLCYKVPFANSLAKYLSAHLVLPWPHAGISGVCGAWGSVSVATPEVLDIWVSSGFEQTVLL